MQHYRICVLRRQKKYIINIKNNLLKPGVRIQHNRLLYYAIAFWNLFRYIISKHFGFRSCCRYNTCFNFSHNSKISSTFLRCCVLLIGKRWSIIHTHLLLTAILLLTLTVIMILKTRWYTTSNSSCPFDRSSIKVIFS